MCNIEKVDLRQIDWQSSREFFESLSEALEKLDEKDESYNFTWVGKRKSIIEAGTPIDKMLRPDVEASKDFDNTENMLIVGDNLDALKILQESYLGKIKMIYIDPPYNTGTSMLYANDYSENMEEFLEKSGQSENGYKLVSNLKTYGRFHSRWLSMMYPRIKSARNLLSDDGFCVLAMDDSELENLIKICNEIFGEENRIGIVTVVHKSEGRNQEKFFGTSNEFALFYAKDKSIANFNSVALDEETKASFNKTDDKGAYRLNNYRRDGGGDHNLRINKPHFFYPIYVSHDLRTISTKKEDDFIEILPITNSGQERTWKTKKDTFEERLNNGLIVAERLNGNIQIFEKYYENQVVKTHWIDPKYHAIHYGTKIVNELLDKDIFDFPKSLYLIEDIIRLTMPREDSIALDMFAGSGTLGHAIMDLNVNEEANRTYIATQLDEKIPEKSEAKRAGYDTIDQITAERLRRAGDKIRKEHPDAKIDTGFRVFRIDSTNENSDITKPLNEITQGELFDSVDNIKKDRTPLDLLFGVVYASGLPFDSKLEIRKIGDNTIYLYGYFGEGSGLVACFDNDIPDSTIKEIARLEPIAAAFKDSSFADSATKINLSEQFRLLSPSTKIKVI